MIFDKRGRKIGLLGGVSFASLYCVMCLIESEDARTSAMLYIHVKQCS
jgi:hypothetical protein